MGKSPAAPRSASYLYYWLSIEQSYEVCSSFTGLHGEEKKNNVSTVISMFLKGLNNYKLDVNQTLLGVGNVELCQKVVDK